MRGMVSPSCFAPEDLQVTFSGTYLLSHGNKSGREPGGRPQGVRKGGY